MESGEWALALKPANTAIRLTKVTRGAASTASGRPVPHWGLDQVLALVEAARRRGRGVKGDRDALLIQTIFDAALRVSEALGLRPTDMMRTPTGYRLQVSGKTGYREVAASPSLIARLQGYAYETSQSRDLRFFPINRHRVWQIVDGAAEVAGLTKPPGVGTVHILRHSGAIERMRVSGNPGASRTNWGTPALPYPPVLSHTQPARGVENPGGGRFRLVSEPQIPGARGYQRRGGRPGLDVDFMAVCDAVRKAWAGSGETITDIAARFGVSRGWIHKWVYPALGYPSRQ